jgi:hypothetical protein
MAVGSARANLLGSMFTGITLRRLVLRTSTNLNLLKGYFEGFIQLVVPWLISIIANVKGAREGTSHMLSDWNLFGTYLFFMNWTFNSVGGAIWNIVYFLGAVNIANSNDPGKHAACILN